MAYDKTFDDFQDAWKLLAPSADCTRKTSFEKTLEQATKRAVFRISEENLTLDVHNPESVSNTLSRVVRIFLDTWFRELRQRDTAGLVEHVIEGQGLTPEEVKGFVRALPESFLNKVMASSGIQQNGYHLLFALEKHCRDQIITDYSVGTKNGRLYVEFTHRDRDPQVGVQMIREFLDTEWSETEREYTSYNDADEKDVP